MFVSVLTARTGTRIPFNLELAFVERYLFYFLGVNYCDRNRRCVNSTLTFSGRNSLDSVSAGFIVER